MPKIAYRSWKPAAKALRLVSLVNAVVADYSARGFSLTLRQVYYRMVADGHIPNNQKEYKTLGEIINSARLAGLVDWNAIEDRTRNLSGHSFWTSADEIVRACVASYRTDPWRAQDHYFEVWVEKEALADVIEQACRPLYVPHFACRGYVSASEMWRAAQRFSAKARAGKTIHLIHLGDHDPSGIDMTRDLSDRLAELSTRDRVGVPRRPMALQVHRIALNMDQVEEFNPPPNPAKLTDSRATGYIDRFGDESWELDALDPQALVDLIRGTIEPHVDRDGWAAIQEQDRREKAAMKAISDNFEDVKAYVDDQGYLADALRELGVAPDEEE